MELTQVILSPYVTEKSHSLVSDKKFTLKVHTKATKNQIKQALKKFYKVDVIKINIIKIQSRNKVKRLGRKQFISKIKGYKKAIVVLKKGQKISGFEVEK